MLEERIRELKEIVAGNDGRNAADPRFARAVDELLRAFYDDIGRISDLPPRALFDLLLIKVLYVGRGSAHADVIDYLGAMLDSFLYARNIFPPDSGGRPQRPYLSDVLRPDIEQDADVAGSAPAGGPGSRFDAYRRYGDQALFLSGVFAPSLQPRRPASRTVIRRRRAPAVDGAYYVTTGKAMYRMASRQEEAERLSQRETLERLAQFFEVYVDALNEMSRRYILGFDFKLMADKMLDSLNRYRRSGDARSLDDARRYAALLRVERERFPGLFEV